MPTTYEPISTVTLASAQSSITIGSGGTIPQTYTDLILVVSINQASGSPQNMLAQFNGDTNTIYSDTIFSGTGSAGDSIRNSNQTKHQMDRYGFAPSTGFNTNIIQIMNYSNTGTFKTTINRVGNAAVGTDAMVHLWRNTAAITSIYLYAGSGGNWAAGSTFTLYGIKAA